MIHNGIEYGMMQAYAEGFALLEGKREFDLDVAAIAETWRHGSVVRSWLLDLTARVPRARRDARRTSRRSSPTRAKAAGPSHEAIEQGVPAPVLALALMARFDSQGKGDYANKMLAMMRKGFGGHAVRGADAEPRR